jgi:hypothetical protein
MAGSGDCCYYYYYYYSPPVLSSLHTHTHDHRSTRTDPQKRPYSPLAVHPLLV